jgi:nicotinate-nucleotide--dimethylbenzimidazole phosphoribosyltransferase
VPLDFTINPVSLQLQPELQAKIDQKTKPLGALGQLESLALKIGLIQNTITPSLNKPAIIIFAGDHGIVESGVSAYPQSVTAQMVANFLSGGAAISVFAGQHQLKLLIVDAGVNASIPHPNPLGDSSRRSPTSCIHAVVPKGEGAFSDHPKLIDAKIAKGTKSFLAEPAMTSSQCETAIQRGAELVIQQHQLGCNCIGFGEMGIGNTSSAALLTHCLSDLTLAQCVGRGTGLDDKQLQHKYDVLQKALNLHENMTEPLDVLATFGGFEIAMMVGAHLKAAELSMVIMVDGFIASAALLVAYKLQANVLDYCIFSHVSSEQGHQALLTYLNAQPLLNLDLRLGEGSGIAVSYPLIQSAVLFLNEMATFADAGVDGKTSN